MATIQQDMLTAPSPHFCAAVERRMGRQEWFCVADCAAVFRVSEATVREWIEEGRWWPPT